MKILEDIINLALTALSNVSKGMDDIKRMYPILKGTFQPWMILVPVPFASSNYGFVQSNIDFWP